MYYYQFPPLLHAIHRLTQGDVYEIISLKKVVNKIACYIFKINYPQFKNLKLSFMRLPAVCFIVWDLVSAYKDFFQFLQKIEN